MAFGFPLCLFNRHHPNRKRVKWDGLHFVGKCRYCGKPIRRRDKKRWHEDWLVGDAATPQDPTELMRTPGQPRLPVDHKP